MEEFKVTSNGEVFMVDVNGAQVDVYRTILGGLLSSSYTGEAKIKRGKLVDRDSSTMTEQNWADVEAVVCPKREKAPKSKQEELKF